MNRSLLRCCAAVAVLAAGILAVPAAGQDAAVFPFTLPWDDASPGPTNLSGWNRPIEGEADRLTVGLDGRLYRGTERVRLFGYNISAGAQFPDRASAEKIARRLARFGVNYVRIAQHSNAAPEGWFDPATMAALHAEALDRLDYFIAQLRRRGIYVHLVLKHFRRVYPREVPGYEAPRRAVPDGWPRWGTGITQFFTPVIEQNRAVARQILARRNPHTGLAYAQDPAIAIVEVSNEDGLARLWQAGEIDPLIAAEAAHLGPLRDELQARWNRWLRERYPSDAALRAAWDQGVTPGGAESLANGDLRQDTQGWRLEVREGARAQWQVEADAGPAPGSAALRVQVERAGAETWHVMVVQDRLRLQEGRPYRVTFWARAARSGAKMGVNLQQAQAPYRVLASQPSELTLGDRWQQHAFTLVPSAAEANAKINLILGYGAQTVWLAGLSLQEARVAGLRDGESAAGSSVLSFLRRDSGLRTPAAQRDWMAFLFDLEARFFTEEFRFLKDELQVRALLTGTQSDFSPVTVQAAFDAVSMHAYWAHPRFPGRPWDPEDWSVQNRAMVNARGEWHTLARIAFRRLVGRPLVVDEYNHPQPNTFGAEGFPLLAAYGAFQDWDGAAGWAYREGWQPRFLTEEDWARPAIRNYFAIDADPVKMLSGWLAAVVFRRGDVAPGAQQVVLGLTVEQDQEIARTIGVGRAHEAISRGAATLLLRHRVGVQIGAPSASPPTPPTGLEPIASDTGELAWDMRRQGRGLVTVNTPRTKMMIGYGSGLEFALGEVTLQPGPTAQQGFGVWAVAALDGALPIGRARRIIVVALGYSQNTGMGWKIYPDRRLPGPPPEGAAVTLGRGWGEPPVLVEGVPARIILPATGERVQAWALDERGQRREVLPVRFDRGRSVVEIGQAYRTLWYEIAIGSP